MASTSSSRFLSKGFKEQLQQTENRFQLWHLQQQGSVADFNYVFDSLSADLDVPEDYLVDAYVYGLKKQIADSVGLFHPRTIPEAKILARMQEIIIEMRTEKARKELEDQERGGPCSTNTQEGPVDHTTPDEVQEDDESLQSPDLEQETESHDEAQVTLYAIEQNDNTKTSYGVIELSTTTEKTKDAKNVYRCGNVLNIGILGPTQSASSAIDAMEDATKKHKETKMNFGRSGFPTNELVSNFRTPETWKNAKVASGVSGSFGLISFLALSCHLVSSVSWR